MPRNAEIIPRNSAVIKMSPHFSSRVFILVRPPRSRFKNSGTMIRGVMQPVVITHIMAENTFGSVMLFEIERPNAFAAASAAGSSYVTAPSTLRRIQGSATPSALERVISPSRIEMDGVMVKMIDDSAAFFITLPSIPSARPCRTALTRKNIDCAMTNTATMPPRANMTVPFLKSFKVTAPFLTAACTRRNLFRQQIGLTESELL